jgi:hypothetical protein
MDDETIDAIEALARDEATLIYLGRTTFEKSAKQFDFTPEQRKLFTEKVNAAIRSLEVMCSKFRI